MKNRIIITLCAILLASGMAQAGTDYTFNVAPSDLADGPAFDNGQGGEPFGFDHGPDPAQGPPIGVNVAGPTGFGPNSFWSDVQGSAAGNPDDRDYTSLRLSPKDMFGVGSVTVGELSKISYWTKQQFDVDDIGSPANADMAWQIKIYTEGDPGNWYGVNIELTKPLRDDTDWNLNSTDSNLTVYKTVIKDAGFSSLSNGDPFSDAIAEYGTENILFIDIIAGWQSNSPPVYSYLDGIKLELTGGDTATINTVPVPGAVLLGAMGLGMVGWMKRRKKEA